MLAALVRMLERVDVLSLDVFDTALLRDVGHPADVFDFVEQQHAYRGAGPTSFAAMRRLAEREARLIAGPAREEVTLDQIYEQMPRALQPLRALECDAEARLARANLFMLVLARAALRMGRRLVFVTDMYLPAETIESLLDASGYARPFSVFVSSAHARSKGSGLFATVADALGVAPSRILHLGDHPIADVVMPLRCGWGAVLYERCAARAGFRETAETPGESVYQGLVQRRLFSWRGDGDTLCRWFALGYRVLGPLTVGFGGGPFPVPASGRASRLVRCWRHGSGHEANELRAGAAAMAADFARVRNNFPWLTLAPHAALQPLARIPRNPMAALPPP